MLIAYLSKYTVNFNPLTKMGLLTPLERQVLELIIDGNSAYAIARKLEKDPPTIYRARDNARKKLEEAEKDLEWARQLGFPEKLESKPKKETEPELRAAF